jgi:4-carboxymuconolactone decarboxylase
LFRGCRYDQVARIGRSPKIQVRRALDFRGRCLGRPAAAARNAAHGVTLGVLTALGGCEPQLEVHIHGALNAGLTPRRSSRCCCIQPSTPGMPRALNATFVAKKVFAEQDLPLVGTQAA